MPIPDSRVNSLLKPLITKLKETPQGMPRPKKLSCRKRGKTSGWKCTISSESNPSKKTCPCITPSMFQYEILNIYANRFSKLIFYILNGIVKIQKFYFSHSSLSSFTGGHCTSFCQPSLESVPTRQQWISELECHSEKLEVNSTLKLIKTSAEGILSRAKRQQWTRNLKSWEKWELNSTSN